MCAVGKCEWACVGGWRTAALDSLLLKRGSPSVGRKAALRVLSAGAQPGSRSLLVAFGFYSPPGESNKEGRTRQTCDTKTNIFLRLAMGVCISDSGGRLAGEEELTGIPERAG